MIRSSFRFVLTAGAVCAVLASSSAHGQVYKWTDEHGAVHYGDNPYSLKEAKGGADVIVPSKKTQAVAEPEPAPEAAPVEEEAAPAAEAAGEKPENGQPKPVEVVGDLEISTSPRGLAVVRATIKSNVNYPVDGIRLDVILYHVEGRRAADLAIPFTGGKTRPDRLAYGEEGVIEEETNLRQEEIAGYNYRLVWAFFDRVTPPEEGQAAPEDVHYKLIPGTPKTQEQAGTEQTGGTAKAPEQKPAAQQPPAEPKKEYKRVIKQKKLERERSGSPQQQTSTAPAPTTP